MPSQWSNGDPFSINHEFSLTGQLDIAICAHHVPGIDSERARKWDERSYEIGLARVYDDPRTDPRFPQAFENMAQAGIPIETINCIRRQRVEYFPSSFDDKIGTMGTCYELGTTVLGRRLLRYYQENKGSGKCLLENLLHTPQVRTFSDGGQKPESQGPTKVVADDGVFGPHAPASALDWARDKEIDSSANTDSRLTLMVQYALMDHGFDPGPKDGRIGPSTLRTIMAWRETRADLVDFDLVTIVSVLIQTAILLAGLDSGPAAGLLGLQARDTIRDWQQKYPSIVGESALRRGVIGDESGKGPVLQPKCAQLSGEYLFEKYAECWEEFEDPTDCHWWSNHYHSNRTARWSGHCSGTLAEGHGTLSISSGSDHATYIGTGTLVRGVRQGAWIESWGDGARFEGALLDGKRNGYGMMKFADGEHYDGQWRNDKPDGQGVYTTNSGNEYEGIWEEGCFTRADGSWAFINTTKEACGFDRLNSCQYANDGVCDVPQFCEPGTDTADCS